MLPHTTQYYKAIYRQYIQKPKKPYHRGDIRNRRRKTATKYLQIARHLHGFLYIQKIEKCPKCHQKDTSDY